MCRTLLKVILAVALLPAAARLQTVDEIIARNIQAHGGLEKMNAVHSRIQTEKLIAGSFKADIRVVNKRPNEVREEFILQGMTQISAYDGKTGWQLNPFQGRREPELMAEDDMKGLVIDSDIDGPLVNYQQKGHKAEFLGHDSVEGTDCYKVKLTLKNSDVRTYYFDTDSYLELKVEIRTFVRGAPQDSEMYYGDYDQVDGIYYPFAIEQGQKGSPDRVRFTVEKVELNPPLDDALFKMPATSAATGPSAGSK